MSTILSFTDFCADPLFNTYAHTKLSWMILSSCSIILPLNNWLQEKEVADGAFYVFERSSGETQKYLKKFSDFD